MQPSNCSLKPESFVAELILREVLIVAKVAYILAYRVIYLLNIKRPRRFQQLLIVLVGVLSLSWRLFIAAAG